MTFCRWWAPQKDGPSDSRVIRGTAGSICQGHSIYSSFRGCEVALVFKTKKRTEMKKKRQPVTRSSWFWLGAPQNSSSTRRLAFPEWTSWSLSRSDQISQATFFCLMNKWAAISRCSEHVYTFNTSSLRCFNSLHLEMLIQSQRAPSSFTPRRVILLRHALRSAIGI